MSEPNFVETRELRRGDVNMRVIINRAHLHMRVMDYRVGNYQEKRQELDELARRERLRKAFTLVEKQDSQNWKVAGFVREGVYPSFFRTADAYVMSRLYDEEGHALEDVGPLKPQPDELTTFPGRRLRKPDGLRLEFVRDRRSVSSLLSGLNGEIRALPFGRTDLPDLVLHAQSRKQEGWILAEIDDSFGHATLGFAPPPSREEEMVLNAFACNSLLETLTQKEVNNLFGLSPSTDRWTNELFAGLGFKVTGRLAIHLRVDDSHATALIWHRRLSERPVS